jgi:hypothetical protein
MKSAIWQRARKMALLRQIKQDEKELTSVEAAATLLQQLQGEARRSIVARGALKHNLLEGIYYAFGDMQHTGKENVRLVVKFTLNKKLQILQKDIEYNLLKRYDPQLERECKTHSQLMVADYIINQIRVDIIHEIFQIPKDL